MSKKCHVLGTSDTDSITSLLRSIRPHLMGDLNSEVVYCPSELQRHEHTMPSHLAHDALELG